MTADKAAATKKLVSYVVVQDAEHPATAFGPGDEVPSWASKLITNPKAYGQE